MKRGRLLKRKRSLVSAGDGTARGGNGGQGNRAVPPSSTWTTTGRSGGCGMWDKRANSITIEQGGAAPAVNACWKFEDCVVFTRVAEQEELHRGGARAAYVAFGGEQARTPGWRRISAFRSSTGPRAISTSARPVRALSSLQERPVRAAGCAGRGEGGQCRDGRHLAPPHYPGCRAAPGRTGCRPLHDGSPRCLAPADDECGDRQSARARPRSRHSQRLAGGRPYAPQQPDLSRVRAASLSHLRGAGLSAPARRAGPSRPISPGTIA